MSTYHGSGENGTMIIGSSNGSECESILRSIIAEGRADVCFPRPCPVSSVYQPRISPDMTFFGKSAFIHTARALDALDDRNVMNITKLYRKAIRYCQMVSSSTNVQLKKCNDNNININEP